MGISNYMRVEKYVDGRWQMVPAPEDEFWSDWKSTYCSHVFANFCNNSCKCGEFELIAPLRGLPEDLSDGVRESPNWDDEQGWGHTWYLLSELLAFDWEKQVTLSHVVCPAEYVELKEKGKLIATEPEMEEFIARVGIDRARKFVFGHAGCPFKNATYNSTYREESTNFFSDLQYLLTLGDPTMVRIIVWCTV